LLLLHYTKAQGHKLNFNKMTEKKYFLDITAALKQHNESNLGGKFLTREDLATLLGTNYQSLVNYQNGRVPAIVGNIMGIVKHTGISLEKLLKTKD
jgi:hypothetical protein